MNLLSMSFGINLSSYYGINLPSSSYGINLSSSSYGINLSSSSYEINLSSSYGINLLFGKKFL